MPDVLTHVLVGYALGATLSIRYGWLSCPFVTAAMVGALLPDVAKVTLIVPSAVVEAALGVPFSWFAIHTPAGSVLLASIGALLVDGAHRRRVFALLLVGAASHHALDALLLSTTGYSYALAWPLSTVHPPSPGLYLSTDRWPAAVAGAVAAVAWFVRGNVSMRDGAV